MTDQILFALVLIGIVWSALKWRQTKDKQFIYTPLIILSLRLERYPFYLPFEFTLSYWGFLGCGILFYKIWQKKLSKSFFPLVLAFFVIAAVLFLQGLQHPECSSTLAHATK